MKIIFYDIRSVAGETLAEIDSYQPLVGVPSIIPNRGDGISIYLEDGTVYVGKLHERKFIIEENKPSTINIVCIGERI